MSGDSEFSTALIESFEAFGHEFNAIAAYFPHAQLQRIATQ